jgi:hypothetical protein
LADVLCNVILPSVLGSSLWSVSCWCLSFHFWFSFLLLYTRFTNSSVIRINIHLFVIITCISASVVRVGDTCLMGRREG